MNISTKNSITTQKILGICSGGSDFICLSDMRLNSTVQKSAMHDLEKTFWFNGYKLLHNSPTSIRGVGILIKKAMWEKIGVIERYETDDGNALALNLSLQNKFFVLCSIHGPNRDNELAFYDVLSNKLKTYHCPIILCGDWNATYDN